MSKSEMSATSDAYLERVADLLADVDEDERVSLLADLAEELREIPESELAQRLGSPEAFAGEYRRSAGMETLAGEELGRQSKVATAVSALALPFGVLVLFSFGGQLVFGPFVLAIEWILARISPKPLRIAWSILGAALAGEVVYLALDIHVQGIDGFPAVLVGFVVAVAVGWLFLRTTDSD